MLGTNPDFIFLGGLREDYCITHDGVAINRILGGNAIYAAAGARIWSESVAILGRVGSNFPQQWLDSIARAGIDTRGIKRLESEQDTRTFYAYLSQVRRVDTHPALHYQRVGEPMPKELIGYESSTLGQDARHHFTEIAVRPEDVPGSYLQATGVHLAPADYLTHSTVPYRFATEGGDNNETIITLDPSERYMTPEFREELPRLLNGIDVFLPSEMEARLFLPQRPFSALELAEHFAAMGPKIIVIKLGPAGQVLLDAENDEHWIIPAYPGRVCDVTGAGDAYCGGFLVGLGQTGSPVEAALHGSVSASLTIEGTGALFPLDSAPGLAQARLEALRPRVKQF
ncbi:MAG: PfkB family carbohydrate kinase [Anaerolineales bacterium]|jgi:sugar/nucleoside kinase (ribokinase family)